MQLEWIATDDTGTSVRFPDAPVADHSICRLWSSIAEGTVRRNDLSQRALLASSDENPIPFFKTSPEVIFLAATSQSLYRLG